VRIRQLTDIPGGTRFCPEDDCSPGLFAGYILNVCNDEIASTPRASGTVCATAVREADALVCVANHLMTVVESAAPTAFRFRASQVTGDVVVPPQDTETNAALAALAAEVAGRAVRAVGTALSPTSTCTNILVQASAASSSAPTGHPLTRATLADELARFHEEALNLTADASLAAAEYGAAVSEVELSRATDTAEAALQMLAADASRSASAHLLVGGAHGLPAIPGVATEGFFTRRPPRGEARVALDLFRAAAQNPALLADTTNVRARV